MLLVPRLAAVWDGCLVTSSPLLEPGSLVTDVEVLGDPAAVGGLGVSLGGPALGDIAGLESLCNNPEIELL